MNRLISLLKSQTIKDTSVTFLGLGVTAVVGFIYTVILARVLGPAQFGVFSSVSALVAIVYSLGDFGLAPAMINFLPKVQKERQALINTGFWFELIVGLVIILFFLILAVFHQFIIPGSLSEQLGIAGILSFNYLLIGFAQSIFTADRQFLRLSFSQIIDAAVKILLVFILFSIARVTISAALLANVFSTIIALFITFGRNLSTIKPIFDRQISDRIFHFSKWIAVSRFFSVLISRVDVLLLNIFSSNIDAGIFSAANRITILFALVVSSLGSVVTPRFSRLVDRDEIIAYVKKLLGLISLLCLLMIGTAILANPIIGIVFGNKYLEAVPIFQLLTLAMIPFVFQVITTSALLYTYNQSAFYAKITAIQVISIIVMDLLLIPSLHLYAPILALAITNILVLIISSLKLQKLISCHSGPDPEST